MGQETSPALPGRQRGREGEGGEPLFPGVWEAYRPQARIPGRPSAPRQMGRGDSGDSGRGPRVAQVMVQRMFLPPHL